jgi:hypothetical protein
MLPPLGVPAAVVGLASFGEADDAGYEIPGKAGLFPG